MDMEQIEEAIEAKRVIQCAGYIDEKHFEECRFNAQAGMLKYGGDFAKALGRTLSLADRNNALNDLRSSYALDSTNDYTRNLLRSLGQRL